MTDLNWLAEQARNIHAYFASIFYILVTVLLLVGVVTEYFKLPLGGVPAFSTLVGRALVAAILMHTLPDVMQVLADLADALTLKMGYDPNLFINMRAKMGEKSLFFFWLHSSLRETLTVITSYLSILIFHFSFYMADALFLYAWTLLYIISPVLIALFVLPVTAPATAGLYRSLIEICCWKPLWWLIATLLWSTAVSDISKAPESELSFLSIICYNLVLRISLLLVPFIVHSLAKSGISQMAPTAGTMASGLLLRLTKTMTKNVLRTAYENKAHAYNAALSGARFASRPFPRARDFMKKVPRARVPKDGPSFFEKPKSKKSKGGSNGGTKKPNTQPITHKEKKES